MRTNTLYPDDKLSYCLKVESFESACIDLSKLLLFKDACTQFESTCTVLIDTVHGTSAGKFSYMRTNVLYLREGTCVYRNGLFISAYVY